MFQSLFRTTQYLLGTGLSPYFFNIFVGGKNGVSFAIFMGEGQKFRKFGGRRKGLTHSGSKWHFSCLALQFFQAVLEALLVSE